MICSNCGKTVPFAGNVCPWCHADKSLDQKRHAMMTLGGIIGALIGLWVGPPCIGWFLGMIPGLIVGLIVGFIQTRR